MIRIELDEQLKLSQACLTDQEVNRLREHQKYAEEKCYKTYVTDKNDYLEYMIRGSPRRRDLHEKVQSLVMEKTNLVQDYLDREIIKLEAKVSRHQLMEEKEKRQLEEMNRKAEVLKRQLLTTNEANVKELLEEKEKEIKEFLLEKKKERHLRHKKMLEQQEIETKRQQEREEEAKKLEKQQLEQRRKQMIEKSHKMKEKLDEEKAKREEHEEKYSKARVSSDQLPLFKKYEEDLDKLLKNKQDQLKRQLKSRKQKMNLSPLDFQKLTQHSRRYEQLLSQQESKRQERMRIRQQSMQQRVKYYSNFKEDDKDPQPTPEELKQPLIEKRRKIKEYDGIVKEKYKPKVDQKKKKQLLNFIEQLHLGAKKLKKIKLQNGSVLFEELPHNDPRIVGNRYLEYAKEMKSQRKKIEVEPSVVSVKTPRIDYLEEVRRQNRQRQNQSQQIPGTSYEQKLRNVQSKSEAIDEQARRKETLIKYGKFMSAEEILKCKEQLDSHYLEVINMKLRLIDERQ